MAITDREGHSDTQGKLKKIDISDIDLPDGESSEVDAKADAYEFPAPPVAGNYPLKLFLGAKGFQMGYADENTENPEMAYYMAFLECKIPEGDYKGRVVLHTASTRVFPGRTTSTMATIINKHLEAKGSDQRIEGRQSAKAVLKVFNKLVGKEPIMWADLDWQSYSSEEEGRGGKKGRNIVTGMEHYPDLESGGKNHVVYDKFGNRCPARCIVDRWTGKAKTSGKVGKDGKAKAKAEEVKPDLGDDVGEELGDVAGLDGLDEL